MSCDTEALRTCPGTKCSFSGKAESEQKAEAQTWTDERSLGHVDPLGLSQEREPAVGPSEKPQVEPGVFSLEESGSRSFTERLKDVEGGLGLSCETPEGSTRANRKQLDRGTSPRRSPSFLKPEGTALPGGGAFWHWPWSEEAGGPLFWGADQFMILGETHTHGLPTTTSYQQTRAGGRHPTLPGTDPSPKPARL